MSRNKVAKLKREIFFLAENGKRRTLFGGEENHLTFSGTFPLGWLVYFFCALEEGHFCRRVICI